MGFTPSHSVLIEQGSPHAPFPQVAAGKGVAGVTASETATVAEAHPTLTSHKTIHSKTSCFV